MSLIRRLQRRFGRYAIPNVTALIIIGQVALYLVQRMRQGGQMNRIALIPELVLEGELWRIVTFLFEPPVAHPLFAMIFWWLFYFFGTTLEQQWGSFRYNLFLLIGYAANVAGAFAAYALGESVAATNGFLYGTVFLAFARLVPDYVLYLMFILPVKVKWLALLQWVFYGYQLIVGGWVARMLVLASVLNYLLFFGREHWQELRQRQRRRSYQSKTSREAGKPRHECRVCGLDSEQSPRTLFRYCSKCEGQQCYCPEHIREHDHVVAKEAARK